MSNPNCKNDVNWAIYNHSCQTRPERLGGSVDLIVTSPPYWVQPNDSLMMPALLREMDGDIPQTYESLLELLTSCFAEAFRALKPGGHAAINVASTREKGVLRPLPSDLIIGLLGLGFQLKEELIWRRWRAYDRRAGTLIQKPYPGYYFPNKNHEWLLIFQKPGPGIYEGRTLQEREASRLETGPLYVFEIASSVWNILPIPPASKEIHPCPFPDELPARLIELYSYKDDLVLDPFTGSGTTGKAAHHLGRRFVGYEINPEFIPLATERKSQPLIRQRHSAYYKTIR